MEQGMKKKTHNLIEYTVVFVLSVIYANVCSTFHGNYLHINFQLWANHDSYPVVSRGGTLQLLEHAVLPGRRGLCQLGAIRW